MPLIEKLRRWLSDSQAPAESAPPALPPVEPPAGSPTREELSLWYKMLTGQPPWADGQVHSLGIPAALCRELSRLALSELNVSITGGERAALLSAALEEALPGLPAALELALGLGGMALRPCLWNGRLLIDATSAAAFTPTAFDPTGRAIAGVFRQTIRRDGAWFTRLEEHAFTRLDSGERAYVVRNRAFRGGEEVKLSSVDDWAGLEGETVLLGLERPLFAYFRSPAGESARPGSPVGASLYAGTTARLIREADEQWERLMWEFQSGERKIFTDGAQAQAGQFAHRLFQSGDFTSGGSLFQPFSPQLRDQDLYRGLQHILRRIEYNVGLSYGTLSDPAAVEKTATEVLAAKSRQRITVHAVQTALQAALGDLLHAMDATATLYGLAPETDWSFRCDWGDGVLEDPDSARADKENDLRLVQAGILQPYEFRMKWLGEERPVAMRLGKGGEEHGDA